MVMIVGIMALLRFEVVIVLNKDLLDMLKRRIIILLPLHFGIIVGRISRRLGLLLLILFALFMPLRIMTMQTTVGVFGGEDYTYKMDVLPLMVANVRNSDRVAISSLNCPPIMAAELYREHLVVSCTNKLKKWQTGNQAKRDKLHYYCFSSLAAFSKKILACSFAYTCCSIWIVSALVKHAGLLVCLFLLYSNICEFYCF